MKLRSKVLFILAGMWLLILLIIYADSRLLLSSHFKKLEINAVVSDTRRAAHGFDSAQMALKLLTDDWGSWDDAYAFMEKKSDKFIRANYMPPTFQNAKINLVVFFDKDENLFYGKNFDLAEGKFREIPVSLLQRVKSEKILAPVIADMKAKTGVLRLPEGFLVYSTSPILKSSGKGPVRGALLMGYFLNHSHIEQLSRTLQMPLYFYPLPLAKSAPEYQVRALHNLTNSPWVVVPVNAWVMNGFTLVKEANGRPIAMLGIRSSRVLFNEGIVTLNYYLIIVVIFGIITLASVWFLLKLFVLDRLINVSRQVINIKKNSTFSSRISISGDDELMGMVSALNSLLEIIELTEDQLKSRIASRTNQLEHLSELNKNLFDEMNRQKSIEEKLREHEKYLQHYAYYDQLTGLPNRMFFREQVQKLVERAAKNGSGVVIMFLDADTFKSINDTWSHEVGDQFLCHVADHLKKIIKDSDMIARYAGDEFVIFLNNIREKSIINLMAEKILKVASTPFITEKCQINSTFSLGISIFPENGKNIAELEHSADVAMYHAKRKQGNVYCYASSPEDSISIK